MQSGNRPVPLSFAPWKHLGRKDELMAEKTVEEFGTESLVGLLQELFEFPDDMLTPTTTLDELGLDSLALMEMGVVIEERTGVEMGTLVDGMSRSEPLDQVARTIARVLAR
ncbi:acyl carrier protein [Streptomyces cavernicola]|uniref:Acyl carrier protein n=1 Tax=Streptomyces cavernicola TaxID=3043613 RepID=A0ABT6SL35_9ACTN|nr:acyl carrier protein [Streptomyces sp. B-S-A6]MDI3408897.1 acyl carrier protein [Streptomyces sp. B-S-A6]